MFVYFYNSFPPFESPIYLGNSARLPLRCFITQTLSFLDRGSKQGFPRLPPLTWLCRTHPSRGPARQNPGIRAPAPTALTCPLPHVPPWAWVRLEGFTEKGPGGGTLARLLGKEQPRLWANTSQAFRWPRSLKLLKEASRAALGKAWFCRLIGV